MKSFQVDIAGKGLFFAEARTGLQAVLEVLNRLKLRYEAVSFKVVEI